MATPRATRARANTAPTNTAQWSVAAIARRAVAAATVAMTRTAATSRQVRRRSVLLSSRAQNGQQDACKRSYREAEHGEKTTDRGRRGPTPSRSLGQRSSERCRANRRERRQRHAAPKSDDQPAGPRWARWPTPLWSSALAMSTAVLPRVIQWCVRSGQGGLSRAAEQSPTTMPPRGHGRSTAQMSSYCANSPTSSAPWTRSRSSTSSMSSTENMTRRMPSVLAGAPSAPC